VFDIAIIGRGLVGSAAARHMAESGQRVVVIGPDEPADRRTSSGPFSSHPDEGRITRIAGRTAAWSHLAARSIERYADIASRSCIDFHASRGLVSCSPIADEWVANGVEAGGAINRVSAEWVLEKTGIKITNSHPIVYEGAPAGYINPRSLVRAQTKLVEQTQSKVIKKAATSLELKLGKYVIGGAWGSISAARVLVATGAFGRELLETPLALQRMCRTTVTAEVLPDPALPSFIMVDPPDARLEEIYWVPPIPYPDGRVALKIGGNLIESKPVEQDDLIEWFQGNGSATEADSLKNCLQELIPQKKVVSWKQKPCVVTNTVSGHPYIGWVEKGLAVAIGGCGAAAKSSDEIGRIAASLFSESGWDSIISEKLFAPIFQN